MAIPAETLLDGWWDAIGCPRCATALGATGEGELSCPVCGERYPQEGEIVRLVTEEKARALAAFSRAYREARLQEGWPLLTPEQARALPFVAPPGYPPLYWQVRRQSYRRLVRWLAEAGVSPDGGAVADLGAGTGWLAYRLAQMGYRVIAVDASLDEAFGLGAARLYAGLSPLAGRLLLAQGDLEYPPLQAGRWGLLILNASLHYAQDLDWVLSRAARALTVGGWLVVLDTPIARRPVPGTGRGDRHLGRRELDRALSDAGLRARWIRVVRGPRWWLYRLKAGLSRSAAFAFPMVVAQKRGK